MHFFGDYCLGGNEYLKVGEYFIRHLPKIGNLDLKRKTYYDPLFKEAARNSKNQNVELEDFSFLQ